GTGAYALSLDFASPSSLPAIPLPNTQLLNSNPLSSGGGQALKRMTGARQFVNSGDDSQKLIAEGVVNTYADGATATDGARPVGMAANGNYVVVWSSAGQDGDGWGVYGQRFDARGTALGGEFRVNSTTAGDQNRPAVAVAPDGSFVVVWQSQG